MSLEENVSQVKSKTYREDTLYQLKIEIDTSLDTLGRVTFTKNLLNLKDYKGRPLEMYPFFAPYKLYRKGKIQRMPLLDRIQLFFNRQRFEQVIFGKKSKTKRRQKKRARIERDEGLETLKEKNFIFTMKMLFSTAFPIVDNFSRSSDYFRSDFTSNFTLKGTGLDFFPLLSGKFDKKFSYLKLNNEIYTVTKVIWVNDIFNHPLYNRIIDNFRKIKDDIGALDKRIEGLQNTKKYLVRLFLELPIENDKRSQEETGGKLESITNSLKNFKRNLGGNNIRPEILRLRDIATDIAPEDNDTQQENNILKMIESYKGRATDNTVINEVFTIIENKYKENLKYLVTSGRNYISLNPSELSFLLKILNTYDSIYINTRAINYIKNFEFRFTQENKEYEEKIRRRIEEIFPRAKEFSDQLTEFAKGRTIGNSKWSKLVQSRELSSEVKKNFEKLADCYTNENCQIDDAASEYVEVELDELTKRPPDAKVEMYEAYLQINIIEGEVTNKNYSKIKCTYLDEELDNFLDNFINPQDDWNIQNEKNYFSVKDVVAKANEELKKEKKGNKQGTNKNKQRKGEPVSDSISTSTSTTTTTDVKQKRQTRKRRKGQ